MNPKKFAQTSHRIAVLSALLVESLEEINASSRAALELKQKAKEIIPHCETILEEVYKAKTIASTQPKKANKDLFFVFFHQVHGIK